MILNILFQAICNMLKDFLIVAAGGGIGSALRYGAALLVRVQNFPYSTLAVNILGSFIIGLVFALSLKNETLSNNWKLFLATGICGGFTTFSAFSMENLHLLQTGKFTSAFTYIAVSIVAGIAATWLGFKLITYNS